MEKDDILQVRDLKKYYPGKNGQVKAVDGVSFSIRRGTTMGLVGESGCGKTTTGRMILRLGGSKTGGEVIFDGIDVYSLSRRQLRHLRPKMQIVFQDPFSSLSPRLPVGEIIAEAVREHKIVNRKALNGYVEEVMERCGLQSFHKNRYPHEFSGGQRQRIGIARALALKPEFIVCDEPVSALDVSVQAQIVNLLQQLQRQDGLTYLFISHDLSVIEHICDRVAIMYLGKIVEIGDKDDIFNNPQHPYTKALLSAIPKVGEFDRTDRIIIEGDIPSPVNPPSGCRFHTRCPYATEACKTDPPVADLGNDHMVACHLCCGCPTEAK